MLSIETRLSIDGCHGSPGSFTPLSSPFVFIRHHRDRYSMVTGPQLTRHSPVITFYYFFIIYLNFFFWGFFLLLYLLSLSF